mmetsp:Transcript_29808/g.79249  ORF Transcript_29808/g.79249 Transcript_29808/m.79249 type:complete len:130 (-) Transcript_29808:321-710(-)
MVRWAGANDAAATNAVAVQAAVQSVAKICDHGLLQVEAARLARLRHEVKRASTARGMPELERLRSLSTDGVLASVVASHDEAQRLQSLSVGLSDFDACPRLATASSPSDEWVVVGENTELGDEWDLVTN